jgi:hypothetical protein
MEVHMAGMKIFISYSHKDDRWRRLLSEQLQVLEREGLVQLWDDQKLHAGENWRESLYQQLLEAQIAILMISPSFLTSDFIRDVEVATLFERCEKEGGTILYPLLIRPCPYEVVGWLRKKQMRPRGPQLRALSTFRGSRLEEICAEVASEIATIAQAAATTAEN